MTGEPSDYSVVGSSAVAAASIMGRGVRFGSVSSRTISQAVKVLAVSDPEAAEEARSAVGWIVGGEDVEDPAAVTLAGVQRFVWYELAVKWMIPDEDKPIIVDALARLLDLLDRPACAEVCRAPLTAKVLAAWARSDDEGRKAFVPSNRPRSRCAHLSLSLPIARSHKKKWSPMRLGRWVSTGGAPTPRTVRVRHHRSWR